MKIWSIYLIFNGSRCYIGSTTDVHRRLRQHNGEIRGGAKATSRTPGQWKLVCWVSGFDGRSSACRWEKLAKMRAKGIVLRTAALFDISKGKCPVGRKHYEVPGGLEYYETIRE